MPTPTHVTSSLALLDTGFINYEKERTYTKSAGSFLVCIKRMVVELDVSSPAPIMK